MTNKMKHVKVHIKNIDADPFILQDKILDFNPVFQFRKHCTFTIIIPVSEYYKIEQLQEELKQSGKTVIITKEEPFAPLPKNK